MRYRRMPIEVESPEQMGYDKIRNNLSESSYTDAILRAFDTGTGLRDLILCYGSHQGHEGLRGLISRDAAGSSGAGTSRLVSSSAGSSQDGSSGDGAGPKGLTSDHVLLTLGAAGALFIIATTLLEKDDELVVVRPNYANNIETPRAIGAAIRYVDLRFEEGFQLDIDRVQKAITGKTRYLSVTYPHNPTGACLDEKELNALIRIAETHNLRLLVDETYRNMVFGAQVPLAATLSPQAISVSSLSKTYGLPGLRTGWIISRDAALMEAFLAAKEQIHICGPILDEALAYRYLLQRDTHFAHIKADILKKFNIVKDWIHREEEWEWIEPKGGCICFPRLRRPQSIDVGAFYQFLLERHGTYVGPGHWFDMPEHYMRIGFGWPSAEQLEEGLDAMSKAVREAASPRFTAG